MASLLDIARSDFFVWGLVFGLAGMVLVRGVSDSSRVRSPALLPYGGVAIAGLWIIAVAIADGEVDRLVPIGLGLLATLPPLAGKVFTSPVAKAVAAVPGAVTLAMAAPQEPGWVTLAVTLPIPLAGLLITDFETRHRNRGLGMVFFAGAVAGSFLSVPDTELIRTLLAVVIPVTFLSWPTPRISLGVAGSYCAVGALAVATTTGGVARPSSIIAALMCLGFLVIEPVAVKISLRLSRVMTSPAATSVMAAMGIVAQAGFVLVVSRLAAPHSDIHSTLEVIFYAVIGAVVALWVLVWLAGPSSDPTR